MNKELSPLEQELLSRADSIFASIAKAATAATDFAAAELPDIAHQFILYNTAVYGMYTIIALIFTVWMIYLTYRDFVVNVRNTKDIQGYGVFGAVGLLPCIVALITQGKYLLLVTLAPKIFLITHIIELIKK